jgi:hypothetical protein
MKRGVIELNKSELVELSSKFPASKVVGTPLESKLTSAYLVIAPQSTGEVSTVGQNPRNDNGDINKIELSEEEIETILDEIGIPEVNESESVKSLRSKFRNILLGMRKD